VPLCEPLPDPTATLATAWHEYRPDQPLPWTLSIRRRLFALEALLLSAGMYGDPPLPPAITYSEHAHQFVRDLGASRNQGLADALTKLAATLEASREQADSELAPNCGLLSARHSLREDPVSVATDWAVQAATDGFAPYFQASVEQQVRHYAVTCSGSEDVQTVPEAVLTCTLRRVGF
jgi:hypothetical protein